MPTYDYQCESCGHRFEVFQSMNDAKLGDCPQQGCGGRVKRLLGTGAGLIFKGSGFYQTDYRSDSYRSGQKTDGKAGEGKSGESKAGENSAPAGKPDGGGCGSACGCAAA